MRRRSARNPDDRSTFALATCLLLALAAGGCRRGAERPLPAPPADDLQTVDVAPAPDARVDPSKDRQERRRAETFSGVLPAGFPTSLPLPPGASLVDQGEGWVEVLVGRPPASVRAQYLQQLAAAGWRVEGGGAALTLRRDGRSVRARLAPEGPSTRLRVDY